MPWKTIWNSHTFTVALLKAYWLRYFSENGNWLIIRKKVTITVYVWLLWWCYVKNMNLPMPTPTMIRPTSRVTLSFARPMITEPAVNTMLPSRITGLRPTLSATHVIAHTISHWVFTQRRNVFRIRFFFGGWEGGGGGAVVRWPRAAESNRQKVWHQN